MNQFFDRFRSQTAAFAHDLITIPIAWMLAYWLRFNLGDVPPEYLHGALHALPWVVLIEGSVYWFFGLYRGVWRFASVPDLVRIVKAVFIATALTVALLFLINRFLHVPRSVPVIYLLIQMMMLAGPRLLYRWLKDRRLDLSSGQRVLIVGAGRGGEMLVRDMLRDPTQTYFPVGFIDDKLRRRGGEVQGIPILGATSEIPQLCQKHGIDLILLAMPSATSKEMRRLVEICEKSRLPFRTVPELHNLVGGQLDIGQLRPVSIEDLLGRAPITLDWTGIRSGLAGRSILVTGAGGSIGSELVRQIATMTPAELILVDQSEFNLYRIEMELNRTHPELNFSRHLVDVTDARAMSEIFLARQPAIVFHAAAYKHVPMLEDQLRAAIHNNIGGTQTVAELAVAHHCERFVLISTDKAVHPANVMGTTKRISEMICQELNAPQSCRFITVRFGNVLGSAGSVVPLFQKQIELGGPVTVTHPEIERFFMTIPEACQLIMQAAVIGEGGEIFVLDMGEPVKIRYLAEQMIRLSGREVGTDIEIKYVGLRPGEKLYEELFYATEDLIPTPHAKIRIARCGTCGPPGSHLQQARDLRTVAQAGNVPAMVQGLGNLVPDWYAHRLAEQASDIRSEEPPSPGQPDN